MKKEVLSPSGVHRPVGEYSHAVRASPFLFVAGQISVDMDGNTVGREDIATQTRTAFENLKGVLVSAGSSLDEVVHINIYVTDMAAFQSRAKGIRRTYFPREFPSITVVEVKGLARPDYMVEIEAVAVISR